MPLLKTPTARKLQRVLSFGNEILIRSAQKTQQLVIFHYENT